MNDSQTASSALGSYRMYIDGQWGNSEASETIEVENPANEEIIATIPAGTINDAHRALKAAKRAQPKWAALPPIERAKLLHNLADSILAQRDHLAQIVTLEQGKPLKEAIGEVGATETFLRYAAESTKDLAIIATPPISVRSQFRARTPKKK